MRNLYCHTPLWEVTQKLVAVAMGRRPADTVIKNARLINVCTREIISDSQVAVAAGRIALVGEASHCIGEETTVIDAEDCYLAPGFLDGHIHVESSMVSVGEYARAVVPHGTTGIFMDPHEIANVLGLDGIRCMVEDSRRAPLKAMLTVPSCVPAVPGFEDAGAALGPADIAAAMAWPETIGLGEMMNFPGILSGRDHAHQIVAETLKTDKIVTGHYSLPETAEGLNAYIASGIRCCHESTRAADALAKMRLGMYAMIREGSAWRDLREVIKAITNHEVDSRFAVLVSDDAHPLTLLEKGHVDHLLRRAVEEGVDILTAIQMVTINCAQCFQLDHEMGSIAPGKCADLVFLSDLDSVKVTQVMIDGRLVARDGALCVELPPYTYPPWATNSLHLRDKITPASFAIAGEGPTATVRVIEVIPAKVGTLERKLTVPVKDGQLVADVGQDILKAAVFERHHATGSVGLGFVKGFQITAGAMASTVAHDAHNILVIGANDEDMAIAANALLAAGGGMTVVRDGEILSLVALPIAGLMADQSVAKMSACVAELASAWQAIGCTMASPFMTMALISLACLPELRLTNRGLVDCVNFQFVPLVIE